MKNFNLPIDYRPYIDKYFIRAKEVLQKEKLNPIVKVQVFIRKGGVKVYGIDEAIAILTKYSDIEKTGHIYSLKEGDKFKLGETLMIIEAPIQSIIDLETMYLGVLSAETTIQNDNKDINLSEIKDGMGKIVNLAGNRPISYFGARHWRYDRDYEISKVCHLAGAENCSTDSGAKGYAYPFSKGIGTIPHSLEAIYHWKYGLRNAVLKSTEAFDRIIDSIVPRIALVDYANLEIADSIRVAESLKERLYGIRIDTCGENAMQDGYIMETPEMPFWYGNGVTVSGVAKVRKALIDKGFENVKVILSSGFGNPDKVKQFIKFEEREGMKLFDGLGVGGVFDSRMATADVIEVEGKETHKAGRVYKPNRRLERIF